jgi:hypothetical protein
MSVILFSSGCIVSYVCFSLHTCSLLCDFWTSLKVCLFVFKKLYIHFLCNYNKLPFALMHQQFILLQFLKSEVQISITGLKLRCWPSPDSFVSSKEKRTHSRPASGDCWHSLACGQFLYYYQISLLPMSPWLSFNIDFKLFSLHLYHYCIMCGPVRIMKIIAN